MPKSVWGDKKLLQVIIIRKQLRDSDAKWEKKVETLEEEVKALKETRDSTLPFKVDPARKTVWLKNWNLHIESSDQEYDGVGNLIVGSGHEYRHGGPESLQ